MNLTPVLMDPELGFTAFTVQRTSYRRGSGASVPSVRTLPASGCIHPGTPEQLQLLPEEDRHEEFIAVYTDFPLSLGTNDGGETYSAPDRIQWKGESWRLVSLRDWSAFGYVQARAVKLNEFLTAECPDLDEFLFLPVTLGLWRQHELWDGTYTLDDLLDAVELICVRRENEKRAQAQVGSAL